MNLLTIRGHSPAPQLDAAFAALSDASRRKMIRVLLQKPRRAGELAQCVDMSPQALSRHLRVLRKAGLVSEQGIADDARVRIYSVHPAALNRCSTGWRRSKTYGVISCRRSKVSLKIRRQPENPRHER